MAANQVPATLVVISIAIVALIFFLGLSGISGAKISNIFAPLLSSVSEPAKPELVASVSCINEDFPAGSPLNGVATHSTLTITAKNSGETDARPSRGITARVFWSGFTYIAPSGQVTSLFLSTRNKIEKFVAADISHARPATGSYATPYSQCLDDGLSKSEVCLLYVLGEDQLPINDNAPPGTYEIELDAPAPGNVIEAKQELNKDSTECAGTVMKDCLTQPAQASGAVFCKPECRNYERSGFRQTVGYDCGGCINPKQITQPEVDDSDPVCTDSCGCACPPESLNYEKYGPRYDKYHQIPPGERCGRKLPDIIMLLDTQNSLRAYNNGLGDTKQPFVVCIDVKRTSDGLPVRQTEEHTVNSNIPPGGFASLNYQKATLGTTVEVTADCQEEIKELDETNNGATKQF